MPPSTTKLAPVTKPDFSRSSRNATTSAISWGLPTRPAGCWAWSLALELGVVAGRDPAGAHAIDPDVGAEADGERVGQREQPALGGRVGFGVGLRHQRPRRGDGDDRALGRAQRPLRRPRQQECRRQVDVEDAPPVLERQPPDRPPDEDAGVGDDGVEPAEPVEREAHRLAHDVLVRDVALHGGRRSRPAAEVLRSAASSAGRRASTHQPASSRWCEMARPMPFAAPVTSATGRFGFAADRVAARAIG